MLGEYFFRNYLKNDSIGDIYATNWFEYRNSPKVQARYYISAKGDDDHTLTPEFESDYTNQAGKYRIIVLGDSFTHGLGLDNENLRFTNLLQEKLGNDFFIINLGWGGADIDDYERVQKIYFQNHTANLTIIAYFPNDIDPDIVERKGMSDLDFITPFAKNSAFVYYFKRSVENKFQLYLNYYKFAYSNENNLKNHEKTLSRIIKYSKEKGSDEIIMSIPFLYQLADFKKYPMVHQIKFISNVTHKNNASFLDIYPYFEGYDPVELWVSRFDQHPNELGHEIIADAIYQKLKEMKIYDAKR